MKKEVIRLIEKLIMIGLILIKFINLIEPVIYIVNCLLIILYYYIMLEINYIRLNLGTDRRI